MADVEVILDDTNPLVQYTSGTWVPSKVDVDGATHSVTCAESPGSVSVTYKFNYVVVWAYYWPGNDVPQVTCTIDGKSVQVLDPPDTSSNPDIYWQWYVCQAQGLTPQNHTVEVTVTEATQIQNFCLDTFDVMAPQPAQLIQESGGSSTSTTSLSSPTSSHSGVAANAKTPVGAIVGGTLGAIALTLVICGALFLWYRRRKQHQYARMAGDDDDFGRDSIHSRRRSTLMSSFRFRPWGRKKQRREPAWVEVRHPVSIVPPLLEEPSFAQRENVTATVDVTRTSRVDLPPEDRTVSPQDLGLPDLPISGMLEDAGGHADVAVPAQHRMVSPPTTPQSAADSGMAPSVHSSSPPVDSGTK